MRTTPKATAALGAALMLSAGALAQVDYGYHYDDYGYYRADYGWHTEDEWFDGWYQDADEDWYTPYDEDEGWFDWF